MTSGGRRASARRCLWPMPMPATTSSRRCATRRRASRWGWPTSGSAGSGMTPSRSSSWAIALRSATRLPARLWPRATRARCCCARGFASRGRAATRWLTASGGVSCSPSTRCRARWWHSAGACSTLPPRLPSTRTHPSRRYITRATSSTACTSPSVPSSSRTVAISSRATPMSSRCTSRGWRTWSPRLALR